MSLFNRTYTFADGTTAYGSQVEAEIGNIVTVLNNLNIASSTWGQVSALNATSIPLLADCAAGSQNIANFLNNSVIKASFSSAGLLTCAGATVSGTADFTGQLKGKGTATNDSAPAGYLGEYIESVVAAVNFPTSTQFGDAASISLTTGDWDVTLNFLGNSNGGTQTVMQCGISTTTGNSATGLVFGSNRMEVPLPNATINGSATIANWRQSLSGTTTIYAKMTSTYSSTAPQANCRLSARRIR